MRLVQSDHPLGNRFPGLLDWQSAATSVGEWSDHVSKLAEAAQEQIRESTTLYGDVLVLQELILCAAHEARVEDWDGEGAKAISPRTLETALRFAEVIPAGFTMPDVYAEPRGEITLEWLIAPRRTLLISVYPNGEIGYSALVGTSRAYGRAPFVGDVPVMVMALLRQVAA